MADITNELMYEVLKKIQSDMSELKEGQREANSRLNALLTHLIALQQDVSNIYPRSLVTTPASTASSDDWNSRRRPDDTGG